MTQPITYTVGERRRHAFKASDGTRALVTFILRVEYEPEFDFKIDPEQARVFPCVLAPFGYPAYAKVPLQGDVLPRWIEQHHDDLVDLALKLKHEEEDLY